jgi:hypothetical protein
MPVTPRYKSTAPKVGQGSTVNLRVAEVKSEANSRESIILAAKARASKPKKAKKKR